MCAPVHVAYAIHDVCIGTLPGWSGPARSLVPLPPWMQAKQHEKLLAEGHLHAEQALEDSDDGDLEDAPPPARAPGTSSLATSALPSPSTSYGTAPFDVLLVSMSLFERSDGSLPEFRSLARSLSWSCMVVDEAHLLRDPHSLRARNLRQVRWSLACVPAPSYPGCCARLPLPVPGFIRHVVCHIARCALHGSSISCSTSRPCLALDTHLRCRWQLTLACGSL